MLHQGMYVPDADETRVEDLTSLLLDETLRRPPSGGTSVGRDVRSRAATILSRRIAQEFSRTDRLQIHALPITSPVVRTTMLWHRRLDNQPAHRWLRERIIAVTKTL